MLGEPNQTIAAVGSNQFSDFNIMKPVSSGSQHLLCHTLRPALAAGLRNVFFFLMRRSFQFAFKSDKSTKRRVCLVFLVYSDLLFRSGLKSLSDFLL